MSLRAPYLPHKNVKIDCKFFYIIKYSSGYAGISKPNVMQSCSLKIVYLYLICTYLCFFYMLEMLLL